MINFNDAQTIPFKWYLNKRIVGELLNVLFFSPGSLLGNLSEVMVKVLMVMCSCSLSTVEVAQWTLAQYVLAMY